MRKGSADRLYRILEFDKIRSLLAEKASGNAGAAALKSLEPVTDQFEIDARQDETEEALRIIEQKGSLPLGEYADISGSATYADKDGVLTMEGLLAIAKHLQTVRTALSFLNADIVKEKFPITSSLASVLNANTWLEEKIKTSILSPSEMSDSASPELKRLRREKSRAGDSIKAHLNKLITSASYSDVLQDRLVTMRDGRYVVPVRQEYRHKIAGVVHDSSKGGATLFVEPQAVVELNNRLREIEIEENREIERILAELSALVGGVSHELLVNQRTLIKLDAIFAKGQLALEMEAVRPIVGGSDRLAIEEGRHPLIPRDKVVPVSLAVGAGYRTLIITGPNTGGKTVTLKTVGLFILMAQAGLHLPAVKAQIPNVKNVFADIGDEQSIEQSLSTFSSHMKNIVAIVNSAGAGSFVFLDELGAGTDPTEGAALAISILESIGASGAMILATTHYTELKKYALASDSAMNASMEFDIETLSPTYRLRIGTPGRSNAFEISRKLGLPNEIIKKAESSMDSESVKFDRVIESVDIDRRAAAKEREEAEKLREEIEAERAIIAKKHADLDSKRDAIVEKARVKAENSVDELREYAELVRAELKELLAEAEEYAAGAVQEDGSATRGSFFTKLDEKKKMIDSLSADVGKNSKRRRKESAHEKQPAVLKAEEVNVGDLVRFEGSDEDAEILSLPRVDGMVRIRAGMMRMTVPVSSLHPSTREKAKDKAEKGFRGYTSMSQGKANTISFSINVIGNPLDDAKLIVEKYLDDASIAGLSKVTIIHGIGGGILRDGLRSMLKEHRLVSAVRPGGHGEGGDGATVVRLKE